MNKYIWVRLAKKRGGRHVYSVNIDNVTMNLEYYKGWWKVHMGNMYWGEAKTLAEAKKIAEAI